MGGISGRCLAWRVSQESFMKPVEKWLSNLKLRVSYGVTGNSGGMGLTLHKQELPLILLYLLMAC